MKRTRKKKLIRKQKPLSAQIHRHSKRVPEKKSYDGNTELMISTGSTLLDLAICGKRKRGGGIPAGILLEAFGPNSSGKTVLLSEIAGAIQRKGGDVLFNDPEARLNKQFARLFDFDVDKCIIKEPDTVTEVFQNIREWEPTGKKVNGIMTDSLAALSTNLEMDNDEGDKMGMRRAKEFSEGLRKTCRVLKQKNYIMACSNQIRVKVDAKFGEKFEVPGGKAIGFYSSIRLRHYTPEKVKKIIKVNGKDVVKVIGIKVLIEVYKNSCDEPYRKADLYIQFDYGIDDIRANLQYLKDYRKYSIYCIDEIKLDKSLEKAILMVEDEELEEDLQEAVIDLWYELEEKFNVNRKKKIR